VSSSHTYRQPWLGNPWFDSIYILLPGFLALLVTALLPDAYKYTDAMPLAAWVILILLIDVAHVYSTLYRTYWDRQRFRRQRTLFIAAPVCCYISGVLLYSTDAMLFWRVLAYLAVYHFIRQQYGLMRLYARTEAQSPPGARIDTIAVYAATLYPLLYWHCAPGRNFSWFMQGDFITGQAELLRTIARVVYLLIIAAYVIKETGVFIRNRRVNIPKNAIIAGTFLTWYFGIVYYNGDMAFTLLNVVSHGIPYMALIWLFRRREQSVQGAAPVARTSLLVFLLSIFAFAFLEEGIWDGLVWRERRDLFGIFSFLPALDSAEALALLIPLLALPQATHYVLDGFIWRKEQKGQENSS
jgi:hypothetical protein